MENEFIITFEDLDFGVQGKIKSEIRMYILEDLKTEAMSQNMPFKDFMTHKNHYQLASDTPLIFQNALENLLEELTQQRINKAFKHLSVMI